MESQPCPECKRLLSAYASANEKLSAAQRELANYGIAKDRFEPLWNECADALNRLDEIRDTLTTHHATHFVR